MIRTFLIALISGLSLEVTGQEEIVSNNPLEQGLVRAGQRVGVWQYFDYPGELGLEIDYETMQVLHLKPDSSLFVVREGGRWVRQRLKSPCRPHGSRMLIVENYYRKLNTQYELYRRADQKKEPVETILTFEVGAEGVATNPKVWGYTKFGMEKMMLDAFDSAPNAWIPGIKMDGSVATCRFGAYVKICPDTCAQMAPRDTVDLFYGISNRASKPGSRNPVTTERAGMEFSPDGQWLAVGANLMATMGADGFFIVPTGGGKPVRVPYGSISGMYWKSNTEIAFKYTYSISGTVNGKFDLTTGLVESWTDSATYFERLSPDMKMMMAGRIRNHYLELVKVDVAKGTTEWVGRHSDGDMFPISWSPNQQTCVVKGRRDGVDYLYNFQVSTGTMKQLPIMDAEPCGWSLDGTQLYLQRVNPARYFKGQVFAVDTRTNLLNEVTDKMENFIAAEFSPKAGRFLLLRNFHLFLLSPDLGAKPVKIVSNVSYAVWSREGTEIAYVSEKGRLLSIYDIQTGKSRIVVNLTGK